MIIQLNTDNHIHGSEHFRQPIIDRINNELHRFSEHLSRVDVHFADENKGKTGPHDNRCTIEAHVAGRQSVAVTGHGTDTDLALSTAMGKLKASLTHAMDKAKDHHPKEEI